MSVAEESAALRDHVPAGPKAGAGRPIGETLVLAGLVVFIVVVSLSPLIRLAVGALAPTGNFEPARILRVLATTAVLRAAGNTLQVALVSTLIAVVLGVGAAVVVTLTNARIGRPWVFGFILLLMIPPQVTALAWVQALSPANPFATLFGASIPPDAANFLFSPAGIFILLGFYNAPMVFLAARAALLAIPADLVEAAQAIGAPPGFVLRTVILPLAAPGILTGATLAFVSSIGNFGIQGLLGIPAHYPTMITLVYQRMNSLGPDALPDLAVLALALAALTMIGLGVHGLIARRLDVRVGDGRRIARFELGRWRFPVAALLWAFLVVMLVAPMSALISTSLVGGYGEALNASTITLQHYAEVFFSHAAIRQAFLNSLGLAAATAITLSLVAIPLAYFLAWRPGTTVRLLRLSTDLTYALPGVVIGIAAILFFLRPLPLIGVSIYGTFWIILAAYFSHYLALTLRPTLGGFAQLDRSVEEAAAILGAGFLRRLRDIIAPLVAAPAAAGAILVFLSAMSEIQVSILLVTSNVTTIGSQILFLDEAGSQGLAAAVSCLVIVAVLLIMLLATSLRRHLPAGILPWEP